MPRARTCLPAEFRPQDKRAQAARQVTASAAGLPRDPATEGGAAPGALASTQAGPGRRLAVRAGAGPGLAEPGQERVVCGEMLIVVNAAAP